MKKTLLPLSLGLILALVSCGGTVSSSETGGSSSSQDSSSAASEEASSSSSSSTGSSSSSEGSSSNSSSSEPVSSEKRIDLTGQSDEYASRPGAGLQGTFSLMEIIGTDIYYLSSTNSRAEDGAILLLEKGGVFANATDLVNIASFRLVYELSAGGAATLSFGDGEKPYVSMALPESGILDLVAGTDLGFGYSHFELALSTGSLVLKEVHISFKEEAEPCNIAISMALSSDRADLGTKASDLVESVYLETSEHKNVLLESGYEVVGSVNGRAISNDTVFGAEDTGLLTFHLFYQGLETPAYSVYVYDFDNPPAADSITPNVSRLDLYPGESYSFSYEVAPSSFDPNLVITSSSNPEVLKVEGTRVTALKAGTANVVIEAGTKETTIAVEVLSSAYASVSPITYTASDYSSNFAPSQGEQKVLIVPIRLSGNSTYSWTNEELSRVEYNIFSTENEWSLVNYYGRASNGRIHLTGEVYGTLDHMYEASYSESQLNNDMSGTRLYSMLEDCVAWLAEQSDLDLDSYDSDDDGHVDSIHFIVDGSDHNSNNSGIWPHMATLAMDQGSKDAPTIMSYSLSNLGHLTDALTTIHEQGHIYGLEDYYDYSGMYDLLGGYDMQDIGLGDWNSFSKLSLGWVDPIYAELSSGEEATIKLKPASLGGSPLIVGTNWNGTAFDEYILIELFSKVGNSACEWDAYERDYRADLGDGGIRLYHVDGRLGRFQPLSNGYYRALGYADELPEGPGTSEVYLPGNNNSYWDQSYAAPSVATVTVDGYPVSKYNLIHLIEADGDNSFGEPGRMDRALLSEEDLFETGDRFTLEAYSSSFYEGTRLNKGDAFPYEVTFDEVTPEEATITLSRR